MKLCGDDGGAGGSEVGLKAFLKDMWRRFPTLDDMARGVSRCDFWWHLICIVVWILLHRTFSFSKHIHIDERATHNFLLCSYYGKSQKFAKIYAKNTFALSLSTRDPMKKLSQNFSN
jgi:hypothetical protein